MKNKYSFAVFLIIFFLTSPLFAKGDVMLSISVKEGNFRDANDVETYSTQSTNRANTQYQALVLDNHIAWIQSGQNFLTPQGTQQDINGVTQFGLGYQPVKSGFYVLPHLIDDKHVQLKITRYRQSLSEIGGSTINDQDLQTEVIIPLNQWVKIGQVGNVEMPKDDSSIYSTDTVKNNISATFIKVTVTAD